MIYTEKKPKLDIEHCHIIFHDENSIYCQVSNKVLNNSDFFLIS